MHHNLRHFLLNGDIRAGLLNGYPRRGLIHPYTGRRSLNTDLRGLTGLLVLLSIATTGRGGIRKQLVTDVQDRLLMFKQGRQCLLGKRPQLTVSSGIGITPEQIHGPIVPLDLHPDIRTVEPPSLQAAQPLQLLLVLIIDVAGNGQFLSLRLLRRLFQPVGGRAMVADHPVRELLYALILALVLRQTARLDFKHIRNRSLVHERLGRQRRLLLPGGAGRSAIGRTIAGRLVRLLLRSCRDRHKRGCRKRYGSYQMGFHGRRL